MHRCHHEPTLKEILSDSITRAVMRADRVDLDELEAMLSQVAEGLDAVRSSASAAARHVRALVASMVLLPFMNCPASPDHVPAALPSVTVIDGTVLRSVIVDRPPGEQTNH